MVSTEAFSASTLAVCPIRTVYDSPAVSVFTVILIAPLLVGLVGKPSCRFWISRWVVVAFVDTGERD
jgi:hypothetical protein